MSVDAQAWYRIKEFVAHASGWPMDTLHVLGGVVLQFLLASLLRTSVADVRPWAIVLAVELGNEGYDLWFERWPSLAMQVGEGLRDVIGTMVVPTLLLIIARRRPWLLDGRA